MAGFSQIGEQGFRTAPPRIQNIGGPSGYLGNFNVPSIPTDYADFYKEMSGVGSGADTSAEHMANVFLARSGLGDTGVGNWSGSQSPYGFNSQDWNQINQFMANPLQQGNVNNYQGIVNRLKPRMQASGQFNMYTPTQFNTAMNDLPQRLGVGYGVVPPPVLQNLSIPLPANTPGWRLF